jgi:hypothetical protein
MLLKNKISILRKNTTKQASQPATLSNSSYVYFDNYNDKIDTNLSSPYNIGSGSQTYCWWMKSDEIALNYLITKGISANSNQITIFQKTDTNLRIDLSGTYSHTFVGDISYLNTWVHIAVVIEPTGIKYYQNATLKETHLVAVPPQSNTDNLLFGMSKDSRSFVYYGGLDEIAIWNIALSQSEIASAMGTSISAVGNIELVQYNHCTGWWRFEEGSGTTTANKKQKTNATLVRTVFTNH